MPTLSNAQVAAAAYAVGFRGEDLVKMTAIAKAESSNRTDVYNGICCYGLWQINKNAHKDTIWEANWKDPVVNARMAKKIFNSQGYGAWEVYTTKTYLVHMPAARRAAKRVENAVAGKSDKGGINDWIVDFLKTAGAVVPGGNPLGENPEQTLSGQIAQKGLLGGFGSFFSAGAVNFFEWVADPKMWLRVSLFLAGGILLIIALTKLSGTDKVIASTVKDAVGAATKVKVGKAKAA
jgi:hypothetical protein